MFTRIKRLFGLSEEVPVIPFSEVDAWFADKVKETSLKEDLSTSLEAAKASVHALVSATNKVQGIAVPDLSPNHSIVLQENVKTYTTKVSQLSQKILNHETRDFSGLVQFNESLAAAVKDIRSTKESAVISKFYPLQHDAIQTALNTLAEAQEQLHDVINGEHGLQFVAGVKRSINAVEKKLERKEELLAQIEREDIKLADMQRHKTKLETDLDNLKTGEEYQRYDQLLSKKIKLETALQREKDYAKSEALKEMLESATRQIAGDMAARRVEDIKYKTAHVDQQIQAILESKQQCEAELDGLKIEKDLLNIEKSLSSFAPVQLQ